MCPKLSKSDSLDKAQEQRDREWLATLKPSKHFAKGEFILCDNRRGEILMHKIRRSDSAHVLTIVWDDGSVSTIKPIALNR